MSWKRRLERKYGREGARRFIEKRRADYRDYYRRNIAKKRAQVLAYKKRKGWVLHSGKLRVTRPRIFSKAELKAIISRM
jgi:hypothetical protein